MPESLNRNTCTKPLEAMSPFSHHNSERPENEAGGFTEKQHFRSNRRSQEQIAAVNMAAE